VNLLSGWWIPVHDGDPRALALFKRHYSYRKRTSGNPRGNTLFIGPGEKLVLLTQDCRALFAWQHSTIERLAREKQEGVRCSVFRNEGPVLSSELIREACVWAWQRWPGQRLYTYVNDRKIKSVNPGYCFKMADWQYCDRNKDGRLSVLEKLP